VSPLKKRRTTSPQRVLPPSDSESDTDDAFEPKRRRLASAGRGNDGGWEDEDVGRRVFCPDHTDARGEYGRGYVGFVPCEEAVRGTVTGWAGGKDIKETKETKDKYQACE